MTADNITNPQFEVRLEIFEGPLDLLLKLIERRQLDISKIALAEVAESFLTYLDAHPNMPPGPLASFVWVASKLVWLKSQMLLPRPPAPRSDDEEDPGDELVRRLEAYRRVQSVAAWLRERERQGLRSYERLVSGLGDGAIPSLPDLQEEKPPDTGLEGVTLAKLVRLVQRRMQMALPTTVQVDAPVRGHTITIAEKVAYLRKRLSSLRPGDRIALGGDFVEAAVRSRTELVVLFLAVLEVMRRNLGSVEQDEIFGEIWLSRSAA